MVSAKKESCWRGCSCCCAREGAACESSWRSQENELKGNEVMKSKPLMACGIAFVCLHLEDGGTKVTCHGLQSTCRTDAEADVWRRDER